MTSSCLGDGALAFTLIRGLLVWIISLPRGGALRVWFYLFARNIAIYSSSLSLFFSLVGELHLKLTRSFSMSLLYENLNYSGNIESVSTLCTYSKGNFPLTFCTFLGFCTLGTSTIFGCSIILDCSIIFGCSTTIAFYSIEALDIIISGWMRGLGG